METLIDDIIITKIINSQDSLPVNKFNPLLRELYGDVLTDILKYNTYEDILELLQTQKLDINWQNFESPINTSLNLEYNNKICDYILCSKKRKLANIYINKCRLKQLYHKYLTKNQVPEEFTVETLNEILLETIPTNVQDVIIDQEDLIKFGANLNEIPSKHFFNKNLTSITIPDTVTTIGADVFNSNKLTSVTIPDSVRLIGSCAFQNNQLTSVTIPDSVRLIGDYAFYYNKLTSVTIPNSVKSIGNLAFAYNQLSTITIGNSVTEIGSSAFACNQLTSVTIPDSVKSIGEYAFSGNQLTDVTIPEKFKSKIDNIFRDHENITFTFSNA